ncbi:putative HTH CENPB-type domain-containing protein [Phytophthora infestans]|uniref:Putative HTH CENPB-type domain-containing protein n=1 Tax=Phytophthora infestans TaxID=4787 RepID=A0A8S9UT47_PHYIN|nr:putative HTH CENPB-type domain-containing protein [Phytophthora infestans]
MSTKERINSYYINLQEAMEGLSAAQVWSCDETGFCPQGRAPPRVICSKLMRANVVRSNDRGNMSAMACVSAAGDHISPMFIFPGINRQLE